jgi:hypothetical protein
MPRFGLGILLVISSSALHVSAHGPSDHASHDHPTAALTGRRSPCGHHLAPPMDVIRTAVGHQYEPCQPGAVGCDVHRRRRSLWGPLRIATDYRYLERELSGSPSKLSVIKDRLMPAVTSFLSRALQVRSVSGSLTLRRPCATFFQLVTCRYDNATDTCELRLCHQVIDPVQCGRFVVPSEHLGSQLVCRSPTDCFHTLSGAGAPNADFILYVGASEDAVCASSAGEGTGVLAYASSCHREVGYDRPVSGYVNLCPSQISNGNSQRTQLTQ